MLGRIAVKLATILSVCAFGGCLTKAIAGQTAQSSMPANQYVDSTVCATCHRQIYDSFKKTGMGRSFFRPAPSNTIEDYKDKNHYYSSLSDTHYAMIVRDGVYYQRRWQIGFDGVETNVEEMRIDYVLGSGDQARSYLHRTERDTLIELPLGWYSERGGYWAMSPGFDSKHPQTRRTVSYECTFCHTAYPQLSDEARSQTIDPVFVGKIAEGIDCQRCHGPGGRHVAVMHSSAPTPDEFRRTIVNPAKLDSKRQLEVCMQCHLEPTSGDLPSIIRKFDRGTFSYVSGQPLEDFAQYFDYPQGTKFDNRFQIVSAAYRLQKSRCFLESQRSMTCLNCHDPHKDLPSGEAAVKFYASACNKCHLSTLSERVAAGKHPASKDCVSCHMPKRRTEDVVHAVITDHYIQRRPPNGDLLAELTEQHGSEATEYHGEVIPYYPAQPAPTSENRLYRAAAQVLLQNNLASGADALSKEMSKDPPTRAEFYTTLGDAWMNLKEFAKAAVAYEQGTRLVADQPLLALQGLARAQQKTGDAQKSEETLKRILRLAPLEPNTWYQYSLLDAEQGKREEALTKLKKALALDPNLTEGYFNLANLSVQTGRAQEAEPALMTALSIDPYDAASYDLLGQVMVMKRDLSTALYNFRKATQLRPDQALYFYNYALALIQAGRYDEAKSQILVAIRVNPNYAEAHEILGALYVREKQTTEAVQEYERALSIRPDMNRVHLNLGLLLYSQGDKAGAVTHLRQAASDPNAAVAGPATQALDKIGAR